MRLNQRYINESFADQNLAGVELSGQFIDVDFSGANLAGARLSGTFVDTSFEGADLTDADLSDATFVSSEDDRAQPDGACSVGQWFASVFR